jgi:nitrogen fixation protein NifU and related proteins
MSQSNELYQQVILDHNRKPRNYGKLEGYTHKAEGFNPLCGDHIWVYLKIEEETIVDVRFEGDGCAICKASSSIMTTLVKGQSSEYIETMFSEFHAMVTGDGGMDKDWSHLGKLELFSNIWQYPARVKCAALSWHTVKSALNENETVTTE